MLREGIDHASVFITGNTVIDALLQVVRKLEVPTLRAQFEHMFQYLAADRQMVLITGHRRENFGDGFDRICQALVQTARQFPEVDMVYPVHLNPNVREPVTRLLADVSNIHLIEPLDYLPFVYLMTRAYVILTDSGGIQEEAPALGKPVLVMRDTTERPEAVAAGTVKLVGTQVDVIVGELARLLTDERAYRQMSVAQNPYGDGKACDRIVQALASFCMSLKSA